MTGDELDRYREADGSLVVSEDDFMGPPYTAHRFRSLRRSGHYLALAGRILLYAGGLLIVGLGALALYGWPSAWED